MPSGVTGPLEVRKGLVNWGELVLSHNMPLKGRPVMCVNDGGGVAGLSLVCSSEKGGWGVEDFSVV